MIASKRLTYGNIRESFICHDVNSGLPLGSATADYIVCLEVMEHLENATAFLEEARRVLKPHGRVIISVTQSVLLDGGSEQPEIAA